MSGKKNEELSDLDIAVALNRMDSRLEGIEASIIRMEGNIKDLPCDDLLERIVKLEKDRDSQEKSLVMQGGHIEKIYKITREQGEKLSGQGSMSENLKGIIGIILGAGASALIFFLTRG